MLRSALNMFWCSGETMSIIINIIANFAETRNDETSAERQQPGSMRIADTAQFNSVQDIYWVGSRREVQTADLCPTIVTLM